jgi:nucleoid-associated protein YgaU
MNATIRVIKGTLALVGVTALGLLLRWITAGSISGLRTYDLDSLTVLAVATVAWIAYGWLVLAVVLTALEQIPGAVGKLAGAVAGRITTKTARAILRSGLGVAAVTPLTVGAAQATPGTTAQVSQWTQPASAPQSTNFRATEPHSTVQLGGTGTTNRATQPGSKVQLGGTGASYRATEPRSVVEIGGSDASPAQAAQGRADYRATEPASTVEVGGPDTELHRTSNDSTAPRENTNDYRATEPRSTVEISSTDPTPQTHSDYRATEPPSQVRLTNSTPGTPTRPTTPTPNRPGAGTAGRADGGRTAADRPATPSGPVDSDATPARGQKSANELPAGAKDGSDLPAGRRGQVGVPDRPTAGAPTRYTELRPAVPVRVVVRKGDSLWSIAARELGRGATDDAIAARWPDWYATNRQVIGNDPDLILPGQVLRIPPAPTGDHLPPHPQEQ